MQKMARIVRCKQRIVELPEHVKQLAMGAVASKETTAQIRAFRPVDASPEDQFTYTSPKSPAARVFPGNGKRQALAAISSPEVRAQIQLVKDNGEISCPLTPSRETQRIADKIAQLHKSGHDLDATHKHITQDHFGKEHV